MGNFVGRRLHQFLNMAGRVYYETHIAPLLRMQGFFNEFALDFETAAGERLPVLANAVERRDADGSLLFTAMVVIKATDRRRYERQSSTDNQSPDFTTSIDWTTLPSTTRQGFRVVTSAC